MRLIGVCTAAVVGLAVGVTEHLEPRLLLFGTLVALLGACLTLRQPTWRWLTLVVCAVAAGALRASTLEPMPSSPLEPYANQVIRLGGTLVEPPSISASGASMRLLIEVEALGPAARAQPGAATAGDITPGDYVGTGVPASGPQPGLDPGQNRLGEPASRGPWQPSGASDTQKPVGGHERAGQNVTDTREILDGAISAGQPPPTEAEQRIQTDPGGNSAGLPAGPTGSSAPRARVQVIGDPAVVERLWAGDAVLLEGRVLAGDSRASPIVFFPRLLWRIAGQSPSPMAWLANVRAAASSGVHRYLPEPQASLATGLLLGGSGQLDADFRAQLQRSGLAHLVAIDGYKQVIVAAALGAVGVRLLGARLAAVPIMLGIVGYTLLTGAHPSAVRAAIMVGLACVASTTGRLADPLTSLVLAALAMAALEPRILLDVGFQLSLSATLGIILFWPRLRRRLRGVPSYVAEPVGLTLAVTLATLPVTLSVFQSVSLVSPVAHVVAVPLLPIALASTTLLTVVSSFEPLARVAAWPAWVPSSLLVEIIRVFGGLPGAALSTGRLPTQAAVGLAAGLLVWGMWGLPEAAGVRSRWAKLRLTQRPGAVPAASLSACLVAFGLLQLVRPDGQLHVSTLNAGRGEAVFIRGPTGRTLLVVGGRVDAARLASQVADHLAVWEHKLDSVLWLDLAAERGLGLTLARYPADQRSSAEQDERIDLGGGAAMDVYAGARAGQTSSRPAGGLANAGVSVSFGRIWQPVLGRPPSPMETDATVAPGSGAWELVSDGTDVWVWSLEAG